MFRPIQLKFDYRLVLALFTLLFALFFQTLPLTNSLDFEYSALFGIWFFFTGGIFFLKWKNNETISGFFKGQYKTLLIIVLVPFFISFINSAFLSVCPFGNGILFFLFISVVSLFLGVIIGAVSRVIALKHPYLLFLFFFFLFILVSILEVFFYPQVFTYNPLIGLFPGPIYDELIEFDLKLFFYRVYNIILFTGFLFTVGIIKKNFTLFWEKLNGKRMLRAISSISMVVFFIIVYWIGNLICGFTYPLAKIEGDLGGKLTTDHFIIIYPKDIPREQIEISALHHEFYYNEISYSTGLKPEEKIVSILFNSSSQKKKYIGSANADISKPWLNCAVTDFSNHDITLKHEIVHSFSSLIGGRIFKASYGFNPVLMEGFAMAIDNKEDFGDLYSAANMVKKFNSRISVSSLLSGFNFFGQNSSISYVYSGAFIKFLIDKYGIEKFKAIYTDPDFYKYYGRTLKNLEDDFNLFIELQAYTYNSNKATLFFAGKPLFLKKCPRYVASGMQKGNEYFRDKKYQKSLDLFTDVYRNAESNSALSGIIASMVKLNKKKEALDLLANEIKKFDKTTSFFNLTIQLADLYVRNDDFSKAKELYEKVIRDNPHQEYVFSCEMKLKLSERGNNILKSYVENEIKEKSRILLESPNIDLLNRIFWLVDYNKDKNEANILELYGKSGEISIKNDMDLYIIYKICCFLKDRGKFEEARKIARIILNYYPSDKGIIPLMEENLKKINYFINFSGSIKKRFVFN